MDEPIDLTRASLSELLQRQQRAEADAAHCKANIATIKAELGRRFAASGVEALKQAGKEHGTITLPLQDGFAAKVERKQTVKWDSGQLMAIAKELPWDRVEAMFKIEFSMLESIYKGVAAFSPDMRQKIDEARTTKIGEPVVTLSRGE